MGVNLKQVVRDRIKELGVKQAAAFYGVSIGTVSNWATGKTSPSVDAVEATLALAPEPEPAQELELTMWEGRKVAILQPVYRTLHPDTHFTLVASYAKYGPDKIAVLPPKKRTCIWEARNWLIHQGMKTDAERFIMPDDDMIMPFGNAAMFRHLYGARIPDRCAAHNCISRITSHTPDRGIVGALYFGRNRKGLAQCSLGFEQPHWNAEFRAHTNTGLVPVNWVATGFIKIERWVIEKMKQEIDAGKWPELKPSGEDRPYGYFTPQRAGQGEDVTFGIRALELGIQSYVDADLECLHVGEEVYGSANTHD
jgi:transcriptional regulator with XRE-family HTH domain